MPKFDDLGKRREARVAYSRPGYVLREPKDVSFECLVLDISAHGIRLDIGQLDLPKIFGVYLTPGGSVGRVCERVWRNGSQVGARFLTAKELRERKTALTNHGKFAGKDEDDNELALV